MLESMRQMQLERVRARRVEREVPDCEARGTHVHRGDLAIDCGSNDAARRIAGHLTYLDHLALKDVDGHVSIFALEPVRERLVRDLPALDRTSRHKLREHLIGITGSKDFAQQVVT